jgi:short-subunit dehydrogenase
VATDKDDHDVRDPEAHRAIAGQAAARGPVTVWVNNAGVLWLGAAWEGSADEVRAMVEVNLLGVVYGCRAALDVMSSGDIVNLASMAAFGPVPGLAVYAATKAAVTSYTTTLHADLRLARRPIRAHALCPDTVDTGMVQAIADDERAYMQFSAPKLLTPIQVAEHAVALIGHHRVIRSIPSWRGALARTTGIAPRAALPLVPLFRALGNRRRTQREIRTMRG